MDNCPERMHAADAEAPRPQRIETAVEFWSGMGVETAVEFYSRMKVQSVVGLVSRLLAMRGCFWCTRKKRNKKNKQELKAAGEC